MKTLGFFQGFRNKEIRLSIPLVMLVGIFSLAIPPLSQLEMDTGLEWLFKLRGHRPAPQKITIVTIDKQSSQALQLPNLPRKWPRNLHAKLVDQLTSMGAAVIGFDIIFSEQRSAYDNQAFAESMRRNSNVVLFEYLEMENINGIHIEKSHPPVAVLEQAALAVAPFALPKVPEQIKQAWLFKQGAGSAPTMPVVMAIYHHSATTKTFNTLLKEVLREQNIQPELPPATLARTHPDQAAVAYYQFFSENPEILPLLADKISAVKDLKQRKNLKSLLSVFNSGDGIVLDFYGPPQSIRTIPYYKILADERFDLNNHAVLVGYSEHLQPEQKDGFYTVFTDTAGLDISGVEIMATTLGNLLEARSVQPLPITPKIFLILLFAALVSWILAQFTGYKIIIAAITLAAGYLGAAHWLFSSLAVWMPLTTPLMLQLPLAAVLILITQYRSTKNQTDHLDSAFRRYLPASVADSAISQSNDMLLAEKQKKFATCLATDMINYTQLAETTPPSELHERLNEYFKTMFPTVYANNGLVIDVVGDAMLAIWHDGNQNQITLNALRTAQIIQQHLNANHLSGRPTRMGLHCGEVSLGSVGSGKHFEFRAVGDAVNTTTRIEQLNKLLGTRLLASGEVLQQHPVANSRYLGRFLLRGKKLPLEIFEIQPDDTATTNGAQFSQAIKEFQAGNFTQAASLFLASTQNNPDFAAQFYIQKCQQLGQAPLDPNWDGIVIVK